MDTSRQRAAMLIATAIVLPATMPAVDARHEMRL